MKSERLAGWGNHPVIAGNRRKARALRDLVRFARGSEPVLPQGSCRSYGDACLFPSVVSTLGLDRLLSFDPETGVLRAEGGVTLEKIIRFSLPLGWFLPVTPGTKFPTLGGCIAADIHGKNHHREGSLGNFVDELEMVIADGSVIQCSRNDHSELFRATFGGMGLTGFVYALHSAAAQGLQLLPENLHDQDGQSLRDLPDPRRNPEGVSLLGGLDRLPLPESRARPRLSRQARGGGRDPG